MHNRAVIQLVYSVVVCCVLLCAKQHVAAQERDTQFWTAYEIEVSLARRTSLTLSEEFRFDDDMSSFKMGRTEVGVEYKVASFLKVASAYRITLKTDEVEHAAHINATLKANIRPVEISWRLRLLREFFPDKQPQDEVRNKFTLSFEDTPELVPFIASEVYYTIKENYQKFDRIRWYVGLKRDIGKNQAVKVYYLYQNSIGKNDSEIASIIGVDYSISF